MKVIMTAAGTGGHINPAIAIANKIKKEQPSSEIIFIGTNRGLETDLVPRAGYELKTIEAYGLSKKISISTIKNTIKTIKGISQAKKIIKEFKPDVIIGTGGYICGPVMLAGAKQNIPTILHESNAFPGKAVKMLSRKIDKILVGFEIAKSRIKKANSVVVTGNPTRIKTNRITEDQKNKLLKGLGFSNDKPLILIFGGSQGAKAINDTIIPLINKKLNSNYQIMWAPGPKQYETVKEQIKVNTNNVKIVPYIYNMEETLNACDLVIARSGAMTITELARVGKPAIFIPLPNVSNNHQEYNAEVLKNINAAEIIKEDNLSPEILNKQIQDLIKDKNTLKQMGENARKIDIQNVEEKIYEEIEKTIKNKTEKVNRN